MCFRRHLDGFTALRSRAHLRESGVHCFELGPIGVAACGRSHTAAETGFVWGLGFGWQATDAIELDLGFRQNKSGVIDIESTSLRLNYLF